MVRESAAGTVIGTCTIYGDPARDHVPDTFGVVMLVSAKILDTLSIIQKEKKYFIVFV
jgi:hypothetical protein